MDSQEWMDQLDDCQAKLDAWKTRMGQLEPDAQARYRHQIEVLEAKIHAVRLTIEASRRPQGRPRQG